MTARDWWRSVGVMLLISLVVSALGWKRVLLLAGGGLRYGTLAAVVALLIIAVLAGVVGDGYYPTRRRR